MSDLTFYQQLPTSDDFNHVLTGSAWHDLPADWWIVIADVVNSTDAIQRGAYKEVNTVGVACIAALSNLLHEHKLDFPYLLVGMVQLLRFLLHGTLKLLLLFVQPNKWPNNALV